jgi:hypothetical protein
MTAQSFYASAPELRRSEETLEAYRRFLLSRNGTDFENRDRMMGDFTSSTVRSTLQIDVGRFNRNYASLREPNVSEEELALLALVKLNAGEAYGVEIVGKARARWHDQPAVAAVVERTLLREEQYHTRLLVGAAGHFERVSVRGAWKPVLPLRLIIGALARLPPSLFHPMLLASEIAGVHTFNWALTRLSSLFKDEPAVREVLERRLVEVLVDEIGHISFNRIMTGALGRAVARPLAKVISRANYTTNRELIALGLSAELERIDRFDFKDLPDEVKRRSFFV